MESRRVAILDQIDRLTNDPLADHSQDIQKLKSAYNQIVRNIRNDIPATPRDILDIFPSEVWIQIVKYALPVRGYTSALLLLTMVSNKWMQTLTSVPTLWTYIELRGSQEDSLATVEVFRRLSRDAPVHISIYVPTRHDHATIYAILMNVGPRIHEVTIRPEPGVRGPYEEAWVETWMETWVETSTVLQLLLTGSQFNSCLIYIHLGNEPYSPHFHGSTSELTKNNPLPPSLRAIHGWNFQRRDFQMNPDYLERLEAIGSNSPIELVLSNRIQLPKLQSLMVAAVHLSMELNPEDEEGFPSLQNLTSLTYTRAYSEALMQLLLCAAPQLVYLHLLVPQTKIPPLATALRVAINLRTLMLIIETAWGGEDEQENGRGVCPVYQHIAGETHSLKVLELSVIDDYGRPRPERATPEQAERRGSFLSFLMSTISGLYTKVGSFRLVMTTRYPSLAFDVVLSYVQSLPELRTLQLEGLEGYFPVTEDTYTLEELEYFHTGNVDISHCFRAPRLLYLGFTWGYHRSLDTLKHADLRKISIDAPNSAVVELPASSFPSLQELKVHFNADFHYRTNVYGSFKLTSFPLLRSITISFIETRSFLQQPQGTMLCFALLNYPSVCPSLSEINFHRCFLDWDILFLMLEKRNFMVDGAVSLIRRMTVPFIPSGLTAQLASLLGGIYTERPPNNELFMGGARELLLDEQVPGCIACLLRMRGDCKCLVERTGQDGGSYPDIHYRFITGDRFAWTEIPECGDPITLDWMVRRKSLLEEFILNFATWKKRYHRETNCRREQTQMEIAEDGVIASDDSWQ